MAQAAAAAKVALVAAAEERKVTVVAKAVTAAAISTALAASRMSADLPAPFSPCSSVMRSQISVCHSEGMAVMYSTG